MLSKDISVPAELDGPQIQHAEEKVASLFDIQRVSSALPQCFICLGGAQLTVEAGALRNAAPFQLQGRFHSSSSKVTAAAKNTLEAKAAAAQPLKHLKHGIASKSSATATETLRGAVWERSRGKTGFALPWIFFSSVPLFFHATRTQTCLCPVQKVETT